MKKFLLAACLLLASSALAQTAVQCLVQSVWVPCSTAPQPAFAQAAISNKSTGSVASLTAVFGSNTTKGNSIIVVGGIGNGTAPTISDTGTNTFKQAVISPNSTTFETFIYYATNIVGGADTVTVTNNGATASIAVTVYEVSGLISVGAFQSLDQTAAAFSATSPTSPGIQITPIVPNEFVFVGYGLGTAAQTITLVGNYTNDSGQQNPTTPAGLFSFVSSSIYKSEAVQSQPSATATTEPWAVAAASFKTVSVPVQGSVSVIPPYYQSSYSASATQAQASAGDVFVLPGNATNTVYITRVILSCEQTTAGLVTLQILKRSTADTSGTSSNITVVPDDSKYSAGVSVPKAYSVVPTTGTLIGALDSNYLGCMATGTAASNDIYVMDRRSKPIPLHGTAEQLVVSVPAATGGTYAVKLEWYEQ